MASPPHASVELHFKTALVDGHSPIVQRKSGKTRNGASNGIAAEAFNSRPPFTDSHLDPAQILREGKERARILVASLDDEPRLALARSFCARVISAYWDVSQRRYTELWPLNQAAAFQQVTLSEAARSIADEMGEAAGNLDPIEASYLIGSTYTVMLPKETRSRLGIFYTPPALTRRLIRMSTRAGVNWKTCRVIDPACGGGAFLAPVAAKMIQVNSNLTPRELYLTLSARLHGLEIDPFAAWASQVFVEITTMDVCRRAGERLPPLVTVCNSLLAEHGSAEYDLVIGNPPYGRVTLEPGIRKWFQRALYGHANLYGLFTHLAVQLAKRGGIIAYVTPTSFLAGEYFKRLRGLLASEAPPSNVDFLSLREGIFDDALQETLLAVYKRGGQSKNATVHVIEPGPDGRASISRAGAFTLPEPADGPWLIPRSANQDKLIARLRDMPHRLHDYGYAVSTGPLVWNRHKKQLSPDARPGALPLIWAECVTAAGKFVFRADKKNHQPFFEPKPGDEWLISRQPCVLLQRTTAKEQFRRLIAAELPARFLTQYGAAVVENHLNMLLPRVNRPQVSLKALAALLNTAIADQAFRCISGSVAVSAYELESLPLPPPESVARLENLIRTSGGGQAFEQACRDLFLPDRE